MPFGPAALAYCPFVSDAPESAVSELEAGLLRRVFDVNPDGVVVIDARGKVAAANPAAVTLTGYPHDRLIGLSVDELVPQEARRRHTGLRVAAQRDRVERPMSGSMTLTMVRADGTRVPVEIALNAIDPTVGYMAVIRDVTERVKIKDRLQLSEEVVLLARERERIARDLHDTVLQRLFGLGLELQAAGMRAESPTAERLGTAVDEIDLVIREIRAAVFTLGAAHREGSFGQELGILIAQASRLLGFTPHLRIDGPLEAVLTPEVRVEMVASMREALGNVARHAAATETHVEVTAGEWVTVRITDNGRGLVDPERVLRGNGLRNLKHRAELLGGYCEIADGPSGGTELVWAAPLRATV